MEKETIKLIKLRNPFRNKDCADLPGKYIVDSANWTVELMKGIDATEIDANRSSSEEGCLWVDENEFRDLFKEVIVYYNFNNDVRQALRVRHK